jgi:NAD binding domain of 6-phosphogluconate dehydrogenase
MLLGMIGLGRMGANMAMRLMKAGHECMAELSATPPSHPRGEWPTSANERYLLQKLSLFRVAAFFIALVGNGLILSCSSEFEPSVYSQVPFTDITAYFELRFQR